MTSEANSRRLLLAAGGLAAVGIVSLGATFLASDDSTSEPAVTTSAVSTQVPTPLPATPVSTTVLSTTASSATVSPVTTIPLPPTPTLTSSQVWVFNGSTGQVAPFDFSTRSLGGESPQQLALPDTAEYQMNGAMATLFDSESGKLWVGLATELVGAAFPNDETDTLDAGSQVVLTTDGKVLVVSDGSWSEFTAKNDSDQQDATDTTVPVTTSTVAVTTSTVAVTKTAVPDLFEDDTTVTAVGDTLVYINPDGKVFTDGWSTQVPGGNYVLQQAGPKDDTVLVASSEGLFEVTLDSNEDPKLLLEAAGIPARPVRTGECVYAAWSGERPRWTKSCNGDAPVVAPLADGVFDAALVFRVNGESVALNDVNSGAVWVQFSSTRAVDVWSKAAEVTS